MKKSEDAKLSSCLGCLNLKNLLPTFTTSKSDKSNKKEETVSLSAARCDYNVNDIVPSIRRLSGSSDVIGVGGFKYDPISYAHNFEDGNGDDEYDDDNIGRRFSSRFAVATPSPSIVYSGKARGDVEHLKN